MNNLGRLTMKTRLMIGGIILVFLLVALPRIPLGAAASIPPKKQASEDRWYSGIMFINGRYTSMQREFGPIPFCVLLNCKENEIKVTGINIEYDGWHDQFSFSRISESYFNKITFAGYYLGFCRLGRIHAIAFSVLIWGEHSPAPSCNDSEAFRS